MHFIIWNTLSAALFFPLKTSCFQYWAARTVCFTDHSWLRHLPSMWSSSFETMASKGTINNPWLLYKELSSGFCTFNIFRNNEDRQLLVLHWLKWFSNRFSKMIKRPFLQIPQEIPGEALVPFPCREETKCTCILSGNKYLQMCYPLRFQIKLLSFTYCRVFFIYVGKRHYYHSV